MFGKWIALGLHTSGHNPDTPYIGKTSGLLLQKAVPRDKAVTGPNQRREAAQAAGAVQTAPGVGIAQKDGIIKIKKEPACGAAQEKKLPAQQQLALKYDNLGVT
jgi:hypothetical protein